MQQTQHEMLQAQQESINDLKKMIALLLKKLKKKSKGPKTKASSCKSKGNKRKDENSTFEHSDGNENNFRYENHESSSEESENSKDNLPKKMNSLRNAWRLSQIKAIFKKWGGQTIPIEWDLTSYPCRFKAPNMHPFNGKSSPN